MSGMADMMNYAGKGNYFISICFNLTFCIFGKSSVILVTMQQAGTFREKQQ
jgi:hypothetical protein